MPTVDYDTLWNRGAALAFLNKGGHLFKLRCRTNHQEDTFSTPARRFGRIRSNIDRVEEDVAKPIYIEKTADDLRVESSSHANTTGEEEEERVALHGNNATTKAEARNARISDRCADAHAQ